MLRFFSESLVIVWLIFLIEPKVMNKLSRSKKASCGEIFMCKIEYIFFFCSFGFNSLKLRHKKHSGTER